MLKWWGRLRNFKDDLRNQKVAWDLLKSSFENVEFPILLIRNRSIDDLVYNFVDFADDPDFYFHRYDNRNEFVDSSGTIRTWAYNAEQKFNYPDRIIKKLNFEQIQQLLLAHFKNSRKHIEIENVIHSSKSIKELFENVADYF